MKTLFSLLILATISFGCSSSPKSGTLTVAIAGLPSGVDGNVTVTGPGNYNKTLTATTTLTNVPQGSYTIAGSVVSSGGATYNATVSDSPISVSSGNTAQSSVTYVAVPGSLQVTVSGLPNGTNASITVTGPNGYNQPVTGTITLNSLAPGNYTIVAANATGTSYAYAGTVGGSPAAVSSSNTAAATVNYSAVSGALSIALSGLPNGANANVLVTGPGGYNQQVTAAGMLANLAPGTYTVSVNPARASGAIVDQIYVGTGGSPAVSAGATATISVAYSLRAGTGKVWLPISGATVGYDGSQLASSGSPAPAVSTTTASGFDENAAFDRNGNLWVSNFNNSTIMGFTPSQIASSGSPTPNVTISASSSSLSGPVGLAFDSSGSLWVANDANSTVVKYTSAQLAATGSPAPSVTISATGTSLVNPIGLAFDSGGNLWVANFGNATVVKYGSAQLASTGSPVPDVILSASSGSLSGSLELAFDSNGDLWVANYSNSTVVKFTPAHLAATGSPAPNVILSASSGSLSAPTALAFDNGGDLWVLNQSNHTLVKFTAAQLGASGAPTPPVIIGGVGGTDVGAFGLNPPPVNSPLYQ